MNAYAKALVALALLLIGTATGWFLGADRVQGKWNAEKVVIARAEKLAVINRVKENAEKEAKNAAAIVKINEVHNEEIASVRSALAGSLRRGAGICARPAPAPETYPAGNSDAASTTSGAFRDDIQRDFGAALMGMEEVAATARACQAFVRSIE